jgi:hypothetical protein
VSDETRNKAFDAAAQMISLTLAPRGITVIIQRYEVLIQLDDYQDITLFPSTEDEVPVGIGQRSYDRSGGVSSETLFALVNDFSFALPIIEHLLELHAPSYSALARAQALKPTFERFAAELATDTQP